MSGPTPPALPCAGCGARCCVYAPFRRREFKEVRKRYGIPKGAQVLQGPAGSALVVVGPPEEGRCAFVDPRGRCRIYEHRPLVCRVYGVDPALPCVRIDPEGAARVGQDRAERLLGAASLVKPGLRQVLDRARSLVEGEP